MGKADFEYSLIVLLALEFKDYRQVESAVLRFATGIDECAR